MESNSFGYTTSSTASVSSGVAMPVNRPRKKLVVQKESKIDRECNRPSTYAHRPSKKIVITKWVATFALGALLLACVTDSKLSIIVLSYEMYRNGSRTGDEKYPKLAAKYFVILQILTVVPNVINFLRGIWSGAFRSDLPWPKKTAMIWAVIISFMESFGICLFVFNIPGIAGPQQTVILMNCVFLVPLFSFCYTSLIQDREGNRTSRKAMFVFAMLFELGGVGLTAYLIKDTFQDSKAWMAPVGVILLSISWTPNLLNYLLSTDIAEESNDIPEENGEETYIPEGASGSTSASRNGSVGYQTIEENVQLHTSIRMETRPPPWSNEPARDNQHGRATWKLTILMSFLKIIFTIGISMLIFNVKYFSAIESFPDYSTGWTDWDDVNVYYFVANLASSAIGYLLGYIACTTCMQRGAFSLPLVLTTPLSIFLLMGKDGCKNILISYDSGSCDSDKLLLSLAVVCLVLAQCLSVGWLLFRSQSVVMLKEDQLFWTPMYNSALLEQWLMLVRRNEHSDISFESPIAKAKRSRVIICTTMYREADYEMKQLLESIQSINVAQSLSDRHFEAHVFFDGAVKEKHPTEFVLQLVSLVESVLKVKAEHCSKALTPYGMTYTWKLKVDPGRNGMIFKIHLKDNFKVKNKKRWSQVMYMSYVLDFLMGQTDGASDEEAYILTTDADVRFTPDSVEALLDLMTRDHSVGAVCARTHPLGSGPLVWYQIFEYAIGHWFQKAAEHVLGSVLCSPGCFSVYRCKAVKDILPKYATNVEKAFEFLTKDMGEDRWFCTLLVQSGWRIEYCAASENSTHCPEDFDEFFKQRRRWVASTLANLMLLIKEWSIIGKLNHRVSILFLIYQAILLFATLIGPSSVILVVSGGLKYSWDWGAVPSLVIQLVMCIGFTLICLFSSSKTQLNTAKFLTFVYAVIMTAVVVGTAVQISEDFKGGEGSRSNFISSDIHVSTTTVYISVMAAIFLLAGLLHLKEFVFLLHGIWFLLCLPAGYLILIIYSICNITDRSWGTREVKSHSVLTQQKSWQETLTQAFKSIFFCCFKKAIATVNIAVQTEVIARPSRTISVSDNTDGPGIHESINNADDEYRSMSLDQHHHLGSILEPRSFSASVYAQEIEEDDEELTFNTVQDVKAWLPGDLQQFERNFVDNGFENTMFISGMTEKELKDIGIKRKGMKKYLLEEIKKLPDFEIQAEVPKSLDDWLEIIGLAQYKANFRKEQIRTPKDMEVLKSFGRAEIERELKIKKKGHIKRLLYAIRKLRNPTESELRIIEVRKALSVPKVHYLKEVNVEEYDFWDNLRNFCLLPQSTAFGLEDDLKVRLGDLRNAWLMVFAVSNTLWLILIYTLADKGEILSVFGSNPIGLVVLVLFGLVLIIQFCAMIVHRITTMTHFLGRAPYRVGDTYNTSWAFNDSDIRETVDDIEARQARDNAQNYANRKLSHRRSTFGTLRRRPDDRREEQTHLLSTSNV